MGTIANRPSYIFRFKTVGGLAGATRVPLFTGAVQYGYRVTDAKFPDFESPVNVAYCRNRHWSPGVVAPRRPHYITHVSHPPVVKPAPDIGDPVSLLAGVAKRMATPNKLRDPKVVGEFRAFVRKFCEQNLTPLTEEQNLSFESWLELTNYTEARKDELRQVYKNVQDAGNDDLHTLPDDYRDVKLFVKKEYYESKKYHRGIWSRSDEAKVFFGPFIKSVEREVYKLPYFIKKIPLKERPRYLKELLEEWLGWKIQESDYTSYESHFDLEMKQACEFALYEFMAQGLVDKHKILNRLFSTCGVPSRVRAKFFDLFIDVKRMSGEMDTSLANGFFNLMILLFLVHKYNIPHRGPAVEGDDGLLATDRKSVV